jgi:hypothetical protein
MPRALRAAAATVIVAACPMALGACEAVLDLNELTNLPADGAVPADDSGGEAAAATDAGASDTGGLDAAGGDDGPCSTTIGALSNGSAGRLVTGFDSPSSAGWSFVIDANETSTSLSNSVVSYAAAAGHTCPGAVSLAVPFAEYGFQAVELAYDYQTNPLGYPPWGGATKLHYWLKIGFSDSDGGILDYDASYSDYFEINDDTNFAQWNNYAAQSARNGPSHSFFGGGSFSSGEWQEVILLLQDASQNADAGGFPQPGAGGCLSGGACKVLSQVQIEQSSAMTSIPPAGPAAPVPAILYLDDMWLE